MLSQVPMNVAFSTAAASAAAQLPFAANTRDANFAIVSLARFPNNNWPSCICSRSSSSYNGLVFRRSTVSTDRIAFTRITNSVTLSASMPNAVVAGEWRWYGLSFAGQTSWLYASSLAAGRAGRVDVAQKQTSVLVAQVAENSCPLVVGGYFETGYLHNQAYGIGIALLMLVAGTWTPANIGSLMRDPLAWRSRALFWSRPGMGRVPQNEAGAGIGGVATITGTVTRTGATLPMLRGLIDYDHYASTVRADAMRDLDGRVAQTSTPGARLTVALRAR